MPARTSKPRIGENKGLTPLVVLEELAKHRAKDLEVAQNSLKHHQDGVKKAIADVHQYQKELTEAEQAIKILKEAGTK